MYDYTTVSVRRHSDNEIDRLRKIQGFNYNHSAEVTAPKFRSAVDNAKIKLRPMTHRPSNQRGKRRVARAARATAVRQIYGRS